MEVLKSFLLIFLMPIIIISALAGIFMGLYTLWGNTGAFIGVIVLIWALVSLRIALDINK